MPACGLAEALIVEHVNGRQKVQDLWRQADPPNAEPIGLKSLHGWVQGHVMGPFKAFALLHRVLVLTSFLVQMF